jgi:radical SAM protein with 4Fe4S-binding SPASM domain
MAIEVIDFLHRQTEQSLEIMFFGGEPTLEYKVIGEVIDYLIPTPRRIGLGLTTNCTMLPDELQDAIRRWNGAFNVQLSVDGPQHIQDAYRVRPDGSGSWHLVEETLGKWKLLEQECDHLGISVHGCLNKDTVPHLFDTYKFFREDMGIEKLWYIPVTDQVWTDEDAEEYEAQMRMIAEYVKDRCMIDKDLAEMDNYSPLCHCLQTYTTRGIPCAAGRNFVSIAPDGSISPCHQLHFNTPESSIGDIWSGIDDAKRRIFLDYDDSDFGCGSCEHKRCYRCMAQHYDARGNLFSIPSASYCKLMLVDMKIQDELREFVKEKETNGFI